MRWGGLLLGWLHGNYAYEKLTAIRAVERAEEFEYAKIYIEKLKSDKALAAIEQQKDSYLLGTKLPEAPMKLPYDKHNDLLLSLDGPYELHPHIKNLWEENKHKAPFGNHISGLRSGRHAGPQKYVGMLIAPVEGRGRSAHHNQILTLNYLIEANEKLGIDTSNVENIIFPDISRCDDNVVRVAGKEEKAPECIWTKTI